jgi:hypothetical protein
MLLPQVMGTWEREKQNFKPRPPNQTHKAPVHILLPRQLELSMEPYICKQLGEESGDSSKLLISRQQMMYFFQHQIGKVVKLVRKLASRCPRRRVDKMLLAGGFSLSPYLVACLKQELGDVCSAASIVVPEGPETIILRGGL